MAEIIGKIESLKTLKSELEIRKISRFNSVKEITDFVSNYSLEKNNLINEITKELEKEFLERSNNLKEKNQEKKERKLIENEKINGKINSLIENINSLKKEKYSNYFYKIISIIKCYFLNTKLDYLQKNKESLINSSIKNILNEIEYDKTFVEEYKNNKKQLILKRGKLQLENLEYTLNNIKDLSNIIYGAIGENLVVKEIQKLPDKFVLINDFNLTFSPPIYYKKYNERISSIQIDHLLISNAGIFILETKNWSKSSVNSINLRSPVKQIERSNFALYKYISEKIILNKHHWGEKKIPIRNVIVMIENKPIGEFKYVSVKTLKELNNYITYFEPIFTESETLEIINELS